MPEKRSIIEKDETPEKCFSIGKRFLALLRNACKKIGIEDVFASYFIADEQLLKSVVHLCPNPSNDLRTLPYYVKGLAMIMFFSPKKANGILLAFKCFCLCACSQLFLVTSSCQADQFVLFDVTFDYSKVDADNSKPSKSHYYVKDKMLNENRPKDWTSPIDYRNGTVHVRLTAR